MRRYIDYAVGDIHGRHDLLTALVDACIEDAAKCGSNARFSFLGDIIDRGPQSRDCLDTVRAVLATREGSVAILGNHERYALDVLLSDEPDELAFDRWMRAGADHTLASYCRDLETGYELMKAVRRDHLDLMKGMVPSQRRGRYFLAHAGIDPSRKYDAQSTNDLTTIRNRFLDHVGFLDCVVIHGHTVVGDLPVVTENRGSIDTGAYRSGRLTACVIDGEFLRFMQTAGNGHRVVEVEPILLDRGLGTCVSTAYAMAA